MTDITIPALPAGSTPATTSVFESVEAGASVKYTLAQMKAFVVGPGSVNVTAAKTLTVTNSLTLSGTDGSTLNMGAGGTLGTAATQNTGTSGTNVPLLNGVNTWAGDQTFNGNVGIGMTPVNVLDVTKTQNALSNIRLTNASLGTAAGCSYWLNDGTARNTLLVMFGPNFPTTGMARGNGAMLTTSGDGGLSLRTETPASLYLGTNNAERMQIDGTNGCVGVNSPGVVTDQLTVATSGRRAFNFIQGDPSGTFNLGVLSFYSSPNNATVYYLTGSDTVTGRFTIYSNGGLANYSANNTNLSDATLKTDIQPYDEATLNNLELSFTKLNWGKWKYKDQTHTDWNHGYTAQGVAEAFAYSAPELVDDGEIGPKGSKHKVVYETDLTHIGMALLSRALKRIETLEARLAAAGIA